MIEPLIWMFKLPEFKKHFIYLAAIGLIFFVLATCSLYLTFFVDFYTNKISMIVFAALIIVPILCLTGYFWCLAENIINRQDCLVANSIFNGKIHMVKNIKLPNWDFRKFLWRGIASIFATIILYIPCSFVCLKVFNNLNNLNVSQVMLFCVLLFIISFIPALLWNYAKRDSVVAVLNIPKATYIMGTYTWRYIFNTILFVLFSVVYASLIYFIAGLLGLDSSIFQLNIDSGQSIIIPIPLMLLFLISYITSIYWLFVNAFLLGTLAPTSEA